MTDPRPVEAGLRPTATADSLSVDYDWAAPSSPEQDAAVAVALGGLTAGAVNVSAGAGNGVGTSSYAATADDGDRPTEGSADDAASTSNGSDRPAFDMSSALETIGSPTVTLRTCSRWRDRPRSTGCRTDAGTDLGGATGGRRSQAPPTTPRSRSSPSSNTPTSTPFFRSPTALSATCSCSGVESGIGGTALGNAVAVAFDRASAQEQDRLLTLFNDPGVATDPAKAPDRCPDSDLPSSGTRSSQVTGRSHTNTPLGNAMADAIGKIADARGDPDGVLAGVASAFGPDSTLPTPTNSNPLASTFGDRVPEVSTGPVAPSAFGARWPGLMTGSGDGPSGSSTGTTGGASASERGGLADIDPSHAGSGGGAGGGPSAPAPDTQAVPAPGRRTVSHRRPTSTPASRTSMHPTTRRPMRRRRAGPTPR